MKDITILKVPTSSKFRIVKNSVIKFVVGVLSDLLVCHTRPGTEPFTVRVRVARIA